MYTYQWAKMSQKEKLLIQTKWDTSDLQMYLFSL